MAKSKTYEMAMRIAGKVDKSLKTSCKEAESAVSGIGGAAKTAAKVATAALAAVAATAVTVGMSSVQKAMEFENAMADVVKVVDGLRDENGNLTESYYDMSKSLMDMAKYIPMTTSELAAITAAAGQAGIAAEDLTAFTETAAKMGIAFDTTADQAGEWMATWRTALNLSQEEVTALGDQINYLGNTTSESALKLSEVVTRVGALGKTAGLGAEEVAALAASMPGVSAEISATGIKNMMLAMTAGSSATKKQTSTLKKLGFSATDLAKRMQTDAKGAIVDLLAAMNKLPEAERSATLSQYFGKESVSSIAPLLSNLGYLENQFTKVGDASLYAGSMEAEYASRSDTNANKIQLAQNRIDSLQIKIGQYLLPAVGKGAEVFGGFVDKMAELVDAYGPQVEAFIKTTAQELGARVIPVMQKVFEWLGKVGSFAIKHKDTILALAAGFAAFAGTLVLVINTMKAVRAVMNGVKLVSGLLTSPLGAVALVIGVLVAAGILLYQNWDTIKAKAAELGAKIGEIWGKISGAVENAIAAISERFPILGAYLQGFWDSIKDAWGNVQAIFSNIISFIDNVFSGNWSAAWENIVNIFGSVFGLIVNLAKAPINGVISAINWVLGKINSISFDLPDWGVLGEWAGASIGFNIPTIPQLAAGGIATGPTLAEIGEGGEPEAVLPLSKLAALLDSWGQKPKGGGAPADGDSDTVMFAPVFNFYGPTTREEAEEAGRVSFSEFKRLYRQMKAEERRKSFSPA